MHFVFDLSADDLDSIAARLADRLPKADTGSPWMRLKPAAEYIDTTPEALRKLASRGQIKYHQPGGHRGRLLFAKDDLDAFVTG